MADLKLYSRTQSDMKTLINITATFSNDINMKFGLEKCKILNIRKGKIEPGNYTLPEGGVISALGPDNLYKYLGYQQSKQLDHTTLKNTLTDAYKNRLNRICKTQLTSKRLIKAINTFAIPILTYSFGIVKWTKTDLNNLEIKTRTILTKHNYLHPKAAIERMSLNRSVGGRGLINLTVLWQKQLDNLRYFFHNKAASSTLHRAIVDNDIKFTPLNLAETDTVISLANQTSEIVNHGVEQWKSKVLHGRHPHDLEQPHIDSLASNNFLTNGYLFPETEGFILAIQDQVINTKNYRKFIIKEPGVIDDKCRKCHRQSETIQHITGACITLTQTDYTHRHNQIVNIIHQKLAIKYKLIKDTHTPYYKYAPNPILENKDFKLYYDRAILTDRTIYSNRPDITVHDKLQKTVYIIDIAVPNTHNILKTITEKINKYTELKEEVGRIWKANRVLILPIVVSTTGVIPKHLHNSLRLLKLPATTYVNIQKAAILNTCRIVRKFMQSDESQPNPD